jgi:hypothetical protein
MLALELGHANVDAMLDGMTAQQFNEWKAFFNWRSRKLKELRGT